MDYVTRHNNASTKYSGPWAVVSWSGERNVSCNNAMNGYGICLFANDSTYEGYMLNDMMHDPKAKLIDKDSNSVYHGGFVEDRREGAAMFEHPFGKYEGEYLNNKRHGTGRETDMNGNSFTGRFENGDAVEGKMEYADGSVYIGTMKDDSREGRGKLLTEDGDVIEGVWENDELVQKL